MSVMLQAQERRAAGPPVDPEIDPDVLRRLCALPEDYVLAYFWDMTRQTDDRLGVLLLLTRVIVERPAAWDQRAVRREHERGSGFSTITIDRKRCFGCFASAGRLYFHHIVEVQHGGSNAPRNLVPLCFACHQYLHPWLKDEPAPNQVNGFESLWQIGRRLGKR